jgi:biofilm PGA synthesis N-glycosyltransferase PgaC
MLQFLTGLALDRRYEPSNPIRQLFWAIWYPALYWMITAGTSVVALPVAIRQQGRVAHAIWQSPDR